MPARLASAPEQLPEELVDGVVRLRPWRSEDASLLLAAATDHDIVRWTMVRADLSDGDARAVVQRWLRRRAQGLAAQWRIAAVTDGADMGMVSLTAQDPDDPAAVEIAYWLLPPGRGRGLATAAVDTTVSWVFATAPSVARVALLTLPDNTASEAVARRAGFVATDERLRLLKGEQVVLRRWLRERPDPEVRRS